MGRQFFGTDGIRGRVGQAPMTPDFMLKLGWAAGKVLADNAAEPRIVIGRDTRASGYMIESALEAGLNAAGVNVYLLGAMPTPGVAYLTRTFHAQAGIVISASHNPYYDNGIKFFGADGRKLDDALEEAIENALNDDMDMVGPAELGKAYRIKDASGRYVEFCKASLPSFFDLKGLKIVVDCAHGATYEVAPSVFHELGATVVTIGNQPDGVNINLDVGATKPAALQQAVLQHKADVGVALDGDGDRIIMVDHQGNVVDGDEILYILAMDGLRKDRLQDSGVVGTLMSNLTLETLLAKADIPFCRAKVGDRYVMQQLHEKGWYMGGESSGHIIWLDSTTTGDGIIAGLQVLAVMQEQKQTLRQLLKKYKKCPQVMINLPLSQALTQSDKHALESFSDELNAQFNGQARALIRPSGTEPLVRVMVESPDESVAQREAEKAAENIRKQLGV